MNLRYKFTGFLVIIAAIVAATTSVPVGASEAPYAHAAEPVGTVREIYDGKLYPDIRVNTFRNIDRLFPTRTVRRGETVKALPVSDQPFPEFSFSLNGQSYDLNLVRRIAPPSAVLPDDSF